MHKKDLVKALSAETSFTLKDSEMFLNSFLKVVGDTLKSGESVVLTGFGTFKVVETKERKGRNPQTGKEMLIKAYKKAKFNSGRELKDLVNN